MANANIGNLSFSSGFSSGFATVPLEISNVNVIANDAFVDVESNIIINATAFIIDISTNDINLKVNINVDTESLIIDINANDNYILIDSSINVDELYVDINTEDILLSVSPNIAIDEIYVDINPKSVLLSTDALINTDEIYIDIDTNNVIVQQNVFVYINKVSLTVKPLDVTLKTDVSILSETSVIHIINNDAYVTHSGNISVETLFVDIPINNVIAQSNIYIDTDTNIMEVIYLINDFKIGINYSAEKFDVEIQFREADGVGNTIPDWKDQCDDIDNDFWDRDTDCKEQESDLYNGLSTGMINQHGVPGVWYLVDYSTNNEAVFGEDNDKMVERKFRVMFMIEELPQDDKMWSKFGIEGMDVFHIYISKPHFKEASKYTYEQQLAYYDTLPQPGDIMMSTHNNVFYEAIEVKDKYEMFLQRSHTWDIVLRPLVNKHYSLSPELIGDYLETVTSGTDILSQNDLIDSEKTDVLYDPSNDPYGLF